MDSIFQTLTVDGEVLYLNFKYISFIKQTVVHHPSHHPCAGEKGSTILTVGVISGQSWQICCNKEGHDISNILIRSYYNWARYKAKQNV